MIRAREFVLNDFFVEFYRFPYNKQSQINQIFGIRSDKILLSHFNTNKIQFGKLFFFYFDTKSYTQFFAILNFLIILFI